MKNQETKKKQTKVVYLKDLEEDMILCRKGSEYLVEEVTNTVAVLRNLKTGDVGHIYNRYGVLYGFYIL